MPVGPQLGGAVAPHGDDVGELLAAELAEVLDVVGRVHHDQAPPRDGREQLAIDHRGVGGDSDGKRLSNTASSNGPGSSGPPGHSGHIAPPPAPVVVVLGRTLRVGDTSTHAPVRRS